MLNQFYDRFIFTNNLHYRNFNFYLMDIPLIIMPTELINAVLADGNEELHRSIYYNVKDATKAQLMKQFNFNFGMPADKQLKLIEQFFTGSGWGKVETVNISDEEKHAIVTVTNSPFAKHLKGRSDYEIDHFIRGVLAGVYSAYFREDMECVETKCQCVEAPVCEFVVKKKQEFDFERDEVKKQLRMV